MKPLLTCALMLSLAAGATADEEQKNDDRPARPRRVEIRVEKNATQDDASDVEVKVDGKIVIQGPDGIKEYKLGDELPKDFPLRLEALGGPEGLAILKKSFPQAVDQEPRYMIGIRCEEPNETLRAHLGLNDNAIVVADVVEDLPADKAGIKAHDILLTVNGKDLDGVGSLIEALAGSDGAEVEIGGLRGGKPFSAKVSAEKLTAAQAAKSLEISELPADARWIHKELIGEEPAIRRWIMAPGIRIEDGSELNVEKMIDEARKLARDRAEDVEVRVRKQVNGDDDLKEQIRRLERQIRRLTERLDDIDEDDDEGEDQ